MTAQVSEELIYNNVKYRMASEPLNQYFEKKRIKPNFQFQHTACWRGYEGSWEIKEDKLYLIELSAYVKNYEEVGIAYLFPGQKEVFAEWFSGVVRLTCGNMIQYFHQGYNSIFEEDLFLKFEKGILKNQWSVKNKRIPTIFDDDYEK